MEKEINPAIKKAFAKHWERTRGFAQNPRDSSYQQALADFRAGACAFRNRIAGKCRWLRRDDQSKAAEQIIAVWESECDHESARMELEHYCPNCGKQIEEIKQ